MREQLRDVRTQVEGGNASLLQGARVVQRFGGMLSQARSVMNTWNIAQTRVNTAQIAMNQAIEKYGRGSEEAEKAVSEFRKAQDEANQTLLLAGATYVPQAIAGVIGLGKELLVLRGIMATNAATAKGMWLSILGPLGAVAAGAAIGIEASRPLAEHFKTVVGEKPLTIENLIEEGGRRPGGLASILPSNESSRQVNVTVNVSGTPNAEQVARDLSRMIDEQVG